MARYSPQQATIQHSKEKEILEILNNLAVKRQDFHSQKSLTQRIKRKQSALTHKDASIEELKMLLSLSQEEAQDVHRSYIEERRKSRELEKYLNSLLDRLKHLERYNKNLVFVLSEKDKVLSRYICELISIKSTAEQCDSEVPISEIIHQIDTAVERLSIDDDAFYKEYLESPITSSRPYSSNTNLLSSPTETSFQEDLDVQRLRNQLTETLELYQTSSDQIQEKNTQINQLEEKLSQMKLKVREAESISKSMKSTTSDSEFRIRGINNEVEESRKRNREYESEMNRIDSKHKEKISQLEFKVNSVKGKYRRVHEENAALDEDNLKLRSQMKTLREENTNFNAIQERSRELTQELANLKEKLSQDSSSELKKLHSQLNQLNSTIYTYKISTQSLETKVESLEAENHVLCTQVADLHSELHSGLNSELRETAPHEAMQQLSFIILSKDSSEGLTPKAKSLFKEAFGANCAKLVETYEKTIRKIQKDLTVSKEATSYEQSRLKGVLLEKKGLIESILDRLTGREAEELKRRLQITLQQLVEVENTRITEKRQFGMFEYGDSTEKPTNVGNALLRGNSEELNKIHKITLRNTELTGESLKLREELEASNAQIEQLKNEIRDMGKYMNFGDTLAFLQCEAAALEDIIQDTDEFQSEHSYF